MYYLLKVFLVTSKNGLDYYAMKALKKDVVLQSDEVESTMLERDVCKLGGKNPFLTKLYCSFQNEVIIKKCLAYFCSNFGWFKLNLISNRNICFFLWNFSMAAIWCFIFWSRNSQRNASNSMRPRSSTHLNSCTVKALSIGKKKFKY